MSFAAVQKELDRGLPAPVYLFHGDALLLDTVRTTVVRKLFAEGGGDFNMDLFDGTTVSPEEVATAAATLPFMAPRRLVIVSDADRLKKSALSSLDRVLSDPSPTTVLLFFATKIDRRTGIYADFSKRKIPILAATVTERDLPGWIEVQAAELGFRFGRGVPGHLVERVGGELTTLRREIEKCGLLGKDTVGVEDVEDLLASSKDYGPFDITQQLQRGNGAEALRILNNLLNGGQEAPALIGILRWHYTRQLRNKKSLNRVVEALHEADLDLKTTGKPPRLVMEALVLKLLEAAKP